MNALRAAAIPAVLLIGLAFTAATAVLVSPGAVVVPLVLTVAAMIGVGEWQAHLRRKAAAVAPEPPEDEQQPETDQATTRLRAVK